MDRPTTIGGEHEISDAEPNWTALGRYGTFNLVVVGIQVVAWAALITIADSAQLPLWARVAAVVVFCLMMQGVFTLVHEYCHRNAHHDPRLNYLIGVISCTLFGTSPTLLRVEHWGHHRRNRTESERPELIHPDEGAFRKRVEYYFAILGGIWLGSAVGPLLAPLVSYARVQRVARSSPRNTFIAGLEAFKRGDWQALRLEGLGLYTFWALVLALGPWKWQTIAICYAAFAFSWSSLQWIYHLYTPLHVIEGAYNVRAPWLLRMLFLNFNYNLTHHRHPAIPWQELHRESALRETQPIWYRYLLIFRPPIRFPEDMSVLEKRYF
ncbi:MAG: fatty acid desaturase [Gemmatimonadaceae bacterium]